MAEVLCLTPKEQLPFSRLSSNARAQISDVNTRKDLFLHVPLHLSSCSRQDLGDQREEVGLIVTVLINRGAGT